MSAPSGTTETSSFITLMPTPNHTSELLILAGCHTERTPDMYCT